MWSKNKTHAGLALLTLAVAMPVTASWAATVTVKDISLDTGTGTLSVPSIEAVDANIDEATIKALFTDFAGNAAALASLNAKSVTIPELNISYTVPAVGHTPASTASVVYKDVELDDVVDGVAATVKVGSMAMTGSKEVSADFGSMSAEKFNLAGMLGFYGLVKTASSDTPQVIYQNFAFAGGTFKAPDVDCKIGDVSAAEFKARPLKTSVMDLSKMVADMADESQPSPEQIGKLVHFYTDILTAFESSPVKFSGFDCSGEEEGQQMAMSSGPVTVGGFQPGIYPDITVTKFNITSEPEGHVAVDEFKIKPIDFRKAIALLDATTEPLDEAWFTAHVRELIPSFGGLSLAGLDMDVPDEDTGGRIKAQVGDFDVTLADYTNGIPATISTSANHVAIDVPQEPGGPGEELASLGISTLDLNYALSAKWDEASNTVNVDNLSIDGVNLGSFAMSGSLANATSGLFSADLDQVQATLMGLTVKSLTTKVEDMGLGQIILTRAGMDQGQTADQMRTSISGMAQGMVLAFLGGTPEAQTLSQALGSFVTGDASALSVKLDAKNPEGLGLADLMALQTDPTKLGQVVTITGEASGGPAPKPEVTLPPAQDDSMAPDADSDDDAGMAPDTDSDDDTAVTPDDEDDTGMAPDTGDDAATEAPAPERQKDKF
ncbi:MAG TPA: hypothetical protein VGM83_10825 [Devosiaceae bacterium]